MSSSSMRIIGSSSTTRIRLACVAGRSVAMLHPSAGTGTHPDRIGLTMHCGCPRAFGLCQARNRMGGPGVECTSAGWSAPSPPTPHPIRPRDPGAPKRQGLLLCAEQAEVGGMATAQDRITIYGPKDDWTYIVEFRAAPGDARN